MKDALKNAFKMKEIGPANFILGMEIKHNTTARTLIFKHTRYIDDVVKRFGQENACRQPMCSWVQIVEVAVTRNEFRAERNAIKTILFSDWVPNLHHDMYSSGHSVRGHSALALLGEPRTATLERWSACATLPRVSTSAQNHLPRNLTLKVYSDADWGTNVDDRRSVFGVMAMIGNAPIVLKSKFQRTVALSSAEAEYMALGLSV